MSNDRKNLKKTGLAMLAVAVAAIVLLVMNLMGKLPVLTVVALIVLAIVLVWVGVSNAKIANRPSRSVGEMFKNLASDAAGILSAVAGYLGIGTGNNVVSGLVIAVGVVAMVLGILGLAFGKKVRDSLK